MTFNVGFMKYSHNYGLFTAHDMFAKETYRLEHKFVKHFNWLVEPDITTIVGKLIFFATNDAYGDKYFSYCSFYDETLVYINYEDKINGYVSGNSLDALNRAIDRIKKIYPQLVNNTEEKSI